MNSGEGLSVLYHPLGCVSGQLAAAGKAQLMFDVAAVRFDGVRADVERASDIAGLHSLADELEDL